MEIIPESSTSKTLNPTTEVDIHNRISPTNSRLDDIVNIDEKELLSNMIEVIKLCLYEKNKADYVLANNTGLHRLINQTRNETIDELKYRCYLIISAFSDIPPDTRSCQLITLNIICVVLIFTVLVSFITIIQHVQL